MALGVLQARLATIYDVEVAASVDDFVCTKEAAESAVGHEVERGEVFMLLEDGADTHVGLYVERRAVETLERVSDDGWLEEGFPAFCLAVEGVSHFLYWMFGRENREPVTQFELELQAEVDKYATGLLHGNGVGHRARSRALRQRLFADVRFLDAPGSEQGDRYRDAHRLAARYAEHLEDCFIQGGDLRGLVAALRRFYRLGPGDKVRAASRTT